MGRCTSSFSSKGIQWAEINHSGRVNWTETQMRLVSCSLFTVHSRQGIY